MNDNLIAWLTIAGMAAVTYLTRISGYFIADRIPDLPRGMARTLKYIPGTIIVSIIAPQILSGGVSTWVSAAACVAVSLIFRNLIAVMVAGVLTVSLMRHFILI